MDKNKFFVSFLSTTNYKDELIKYLRTLKNCSWKEYKNVLEAVKGIDVIADDYKKLVFVDDYGIFPFMYLSKSIHVVAPVYDDYSAYMTPFHNNTKIMILGYKMTGFEEATNLIDKYFKKEFEGGRHYARIDMLEKEINISK